MQRTSEINKDRINEIVSVALGAMSVIAIIGILVKKDFETNEVFGSIINFTQVGIPLLVLIITARMHRKSKNFLTEGKKALEKLRNHKKFNKFLTGPQYNQEDYDPDSLSRIHRNQYLYFRRPMKRRKIPFIPLDPLEQGILEIHISKSTLAFIKEIDDEDCIEEAEVKKLRQNIRSAIESYLPQPEKDQNKKNNRLIGKYEYKQNSKNSAVRIDFEQDSMRLREFQNSIYVCCKLALEEVLKEFHKGENG
jgi:hypothetical protein